jgi:hypothetical protein
MQGDFIDSDFTDCDLTDCNFFLNSALMLVESLLMKHLMKVKCSNDRHPSNQGCQMVCFQTKNPNLGKFWRVLQWKMLVYFVDTWSILQYFVIFYGHLV